MARRYGTVTTEGEIALTAATAKTVLQLVAPTNQDVAIRGFSVSFDGIAGSDQPVQVELVIQTTAGTMSSATPVKDNQQHGTIQTTAQKTATVEPTTTDVLRRYDIHPQDGLERVFGGPGDELVITGAQKLGLRCTAPANVNVTGHITFEE